MDPYSGRAFELRESLFGDREVGEQADMEELRERVARLGQEATDDELEAIRATALVRVTEEAATALKLGQRERDRRRRRRKTSRASRQRNR